MPTPISVLLVDETAADRAATAQVLAAVQPEWTALEAGTAEEALSTLADRKAEVALIEYGLSGRDGIELAQQIRARYPDMLIAVISSSREEAVMTRARQVNVSFVPEPVTEAGLRAFLQAVVVKLRTRASPEPGTRSFEP